MTKDETLRVAVFGASGNIGTLIRAMPAISN